MTSQDTAKSGSRTMLAITGTHSATAIGATRLALVIPGFLHIHGAGCRIAMAGGYLSMAVAGAGRRAAGTDGIAGRGWRMRLRDSVLLFRPQTSESSIADPAEIITSRLL